MTETISSANDWRAHLRNRLHRETVSVEDGFFDLGGHSLLATVAAVAVEVELLLREQEGPE